MGSSKITCKLFKLTGFAGLNDVRNNLLKGSYADPLKISARDSEKAKLLTNEERNFYFTWEEVSKLNEIVFSESNGDEETENVEYFFAVADIEYPTRKKKDSKRNFLPKEERVNHAQITTYFFCMNNTVYLIICSSITIHVNRVKKLVGLQHISRLEEEYEIPPDLFNWLFFKYIQNNGTLDNSLKLMNISGFIGNTGDEHNIFKSSSDQTSELIITKAFISNGETLRTITTRLRNESVDIIFTIDDHSNTQIYTNQSKKLKLFEAESDNNFYIIYLYSKLIPKLKALYNEASKQFIENEKNQFSLRIGLEVIESIINKNHLSREDVLELFENIPESHQF